MRDRFNQVSLRNRGWQLVRDVINDAKGDPEMVSAVFVGKNHDAYEKVAMLAYLIEERDGRYATVPDVDRAIKEMIRDMF